MYIDVQRGLYGADHLSFIIEKSSSIRSINMPFISLQYCKLPEPICLGDIYYGPTGNFQYSYGSCPMNYQGFTKRLCQLSTLQIADFSDCRDIEISDFGYDQNRYTLVQNIYVNGLIPHYSGIVHSFLLLGSILFNREWWNRSADWSTIRSFYRRVFRSTEGDLCCSSDDRHGDQS